MRDRPHWSYSAVSQYLRCPLQYFFQRILGLPSHSTGSGLVLGGAVHSALAEYHRGLQTQQPKTRDNLVEVFQQSWQERESREEIAYRDGETREESLDQGVHLLEIYLKEPPPENIVAVEQEVLVPLLNSHGDYLELPLLAVTDLISTANDRLKVTEFKTSGRAYGEGEVATSLQPTCYVHAVNQVYGQEPLVEYTVLVKTKTPKIQHLTTARDAGDAGRLGDLIQTIEGGIRASVFFPIESPLNCSTCPYRRPCRDWGRQPRSNVQPILPQFQPESSCSPNSTEKVAVSVNRLAKANCVAP